MEIKARQCAKFLGLELKGCNCVLKRPSPIDGKFSGAVKFVTKFKEDWLFELNKFPSSFVVASKSYEGKLNIPHVISSSPRLDYCLLLNNFFAEEQLSNIIEKSAIISPTAKIGNNVYIGHNVIIEDNVTVGDSTTILHNVVVSKETCIGKSCLIKSGTIIGQKGFGFERGENSVPVSFPHFGKVIIEDNVEIGALNTIAKGVLEDTIIRFNVKLDDHVHIAHNVDIGEGTLIAACAEISGSVKIGSHSWVSPNSSIIDKCTLKDKVMIGIGATATTDISTGGILVAPPSKFLGSKE